MVITHSQDVPELKIILEDENGNKNLIQQTYTAIKAPVNVFGTYYDEVKLSPIYAPKEEGSYKLWAIVNEDKKIQESDYTNNSKVANFIVAKPHTIIFTQEPSGNPNPVESDDMVNMSATAISSRNLDMTYYWSASCLNLEGSGNFSKNNISNPIWTAPINITDTQQSCNIRAIARVSGHPAESINFSVDVLPKIEKPERFTLNLSKTGNGRVVAKIKGEQPVIDCKSGCIESSYSFELNQEVILRAYPDTGYRFDGWSGNCSGKKGKLPITMDISKNCVANFVPIDVTDDILKFTINIIGTGKGTVTQGDFNCNENRGTCSKFYPKNKIVYPTAKPDINSILNGWKADCAEAENSKTARIMMDNNVNCTIEFKLRDDVKNEDMIEALLANDFMADYSGNDENKIRLQNLLRYSKPIITLVDTYINYSTSGKWPHQLDNIEQNSSDPILEYIRSIMILEENSIRIIGQLINSAGYEEEVKIIIHYGEQPDFGDDPIYFPRNEIDI
ncbi:MAG: hypothetical protein QM487_03830 [Candidatus Marithrix sp.]